MNTEIKIGFNYDEARNHNFTKATITAKELERLLEENKNKAIICLHGLTVEGDLDLEDIKFAGWVKFGDAIFEGAVSFGEAIFDGRVDFEEAIFEDGVDFGWVHFDSEVGGVDWVDQTVFRSLVDFGDATFRDKVDFEYAEFKKQVDFQCATLQGQPLKEIYKLQNNKLINIYMNTTNSAKNLTSLPEVKPSTLDEIKEMNIHQRIHKACGFILENPVAKNGEMKIKGVVLYKYFKAEDVIKSAAKAFCYNGIVMTIKAEIEHTTYDKTTQAGTKTVHYVIIKGTMFLINIDKPDDKLEMFFYGSGEDDGDKAIGKANTYAKKIALMNLFQMQDGEDTDAVVSEEGTYTKKATNSVNRTFEELMKSLQTCKTEEGLEKIVEDINRCKNADEINVKERERLVSEYIATRDNLAKSDKQSTASENNNQ